MGSVYPRRSKKTGKITNYQIAYFDERGKRRYYPGGRDRKVAEAILRKFETEVVAKKAGLIDPREKRYRDEGLRPISEHLDDYFSTKVGVTKRHLYCARTGIERICIATGIERLCDLSRDKVMMARGKIVRYRTNGTANRIVGYIRAFTTWLYETDRLRWDPLKGIKALNEQETQIRHRRSIPEGQLAHLLKVTASEPERFGMSGALRALLYRLALSTGLRFNELVTLTPRHCRLDGPGHPTIEVEIRNAKNRKQATLPLPIPLAAELAKRAAETEPRGRIFPTCSDFGTEFFIPDLEAAGIPYRDEDGKYFDFHALRGQFATMLDEAGIPMGVRQKAMRHSSPVLTARYTRPRDEQHIAAIGQLPPCVTGEVSPSPS